MLDTTAVANAKARKAAEQIGALQKTIISLIEKVDLLEKKVADLEAGRGPVKETKKKKGELDENQ